MRYFAGLLYTAALAGLILSHLSAVAEEKYRDIYLTGDRVCRGCQWSLLPEGRVQLTNKQGLVSAVPAKEVVGVNTHPWIRKLFVKSLHGTGLAAKIIVPYAFEDAQDFVCKYCD